MRIKKALIMPYFGTLPPYFNLWLSSCSYNKSIDYIVFTDNEEAYKLPENVKWIKMKFHEFRNVIIDKLSFNIKLEKPYKLCDFRPLYGYVFQDFIAEYDFWGYCDCDTIWGNIEKFLSDEIFEKNDKILRLGHLSFVRNQEEINTLPLMQSSLKTILGNDIPYAYDEAIDGFYDGFNGILVNNGYRLYLNNRDIADIDYHYFNFKVGNDKENIFRFNQGKLTRYYLNDETVIEQEVMYVHLQKRFMLCEGNIDQDKFEILPNKFNNIYTKISGTHIKGSNIYNHQNPKFNYKKERNQNMSWRIKRFIYEPHKIKAIRSIFDKQNRLLDK